MDEAIEKDVDELYQQAFGSLSSVAENADDLHPYALTSVDDGEGHMIGTDPEMDTEEAISSLYGLMNQMKGEGNLIAFTVITDVTMSNPDTGETLDAIHIALEHRAGFSAAIVVPYTMGDSGREFEEPKRMATEPQVFSGE